MTATAPRTQRERREATMGKLLNATIDCLVDHGYRDTSIGRICDRAGVSHGGLFRHFPSRTALVAAATDEICRRHMANMQALLSTTLDSEDMVVEMVTFFRRATRDSLGAAWREVIVAARTDADLCTAISPAVQHFEDAIMAVAAQMYPGPEAKQLAFGTLILSLLHMFDSEASTVVTFETNDIEALRHDWAVAVLRDGLGA